MKVSLCVEPFFPGKTLLDKVREVKKYGFSVIEFWLWDYGFDGKKFYQGERDIDTLSQLVQRGDIEILSFLINSPRIDIGGSLVDKQDRERFLSRMEKALSIARKIKCKKLIALSGNYQQGLSVKEQRQNMIDTLREAIRSLKEEKVTLLVEPLNSWVDFKDYFLDSSRMGCEIVRALNTPYVKLLYDIYHMQIMEGNIIETISKNTDIIGHLHSASVPGRHELDRGELNYKNIMQEIDTLGYTGAFGLEYFPALPSAESLKSMARFVQQTLDSL